MRNSHYFCHRFCLHSILFTVISFSFVQEKQKEQEKQTSQYPYTDIAKKSVDFLLEKQKENGSFDIGKCEEGRFQGINAIVGLAVLTQKGYTPEIEKLVKYLIKLQRKSGVHLDPKTSKCMAEHGYISMFLLEVYLQVKQGKIKIDDSLKDDISSCISNGIKHTCKVIHSTGAWTYNNSWKYKEVSTSVGNLQALAMAKAAGFEVPDEVIEKALKYIRSRLKDGGFLNGDVEKEPSIHLTPAVVAVLQWFKDYKVDDLIKSGMEFNQKREGGDYYKEWKHDEFERLGKKIQSQAKRLVVRRQMYGLYHACLAYLRAGDEKKFEEIHKAACELLVKNTNSDGRWKSTIGEVGATAFAILTFNLAKKDSLFLFQGTLPKSTKD